MNVYKDRFNLALLFVLVIIVVFSYGLAIALHNQEVENSKENMRDEVIQLNRQYEKEQAEYREQNPYAAPNSTAYLLDNNNRVSKKYELLHAQHRHTIDLYFIFASIVALITYIAFIIVRYKKHTRT